MEGAENLFGITRERFRQIEAAGIDELRCADKRTRPAGQGIAKALSGLADFQGNHRLVWLGCRNASTRFLAGRRFAYRPGVIFFFAGNASG